MRKAVEDNSLETQKIRDVYWREYFEKACKQDKWRMPLAKMVYSGGIALFAAGMIWFRVPLFALPIVLKVVGLISYTAIVSTVITKLAFRAHKKADERIKKDMPVLLQKYKNEYLPSRIRRELCEKQRVCAAFNKRVAQLKAEKKAFNVNILKSRGLP